MTTAADIDISGGLAQNEDPRLSTKPRVLENVTYRKRGGLSPRFGQQAFVNVATAAVGIAAAPSAPDCVGELNGTLYRVGNGQLCALSGSTWAYQGDVSQAHVTRRPFRGSTQRLKEEVIVSNGTVILYAWAETRGPGSVLAYCELRNAATGARIGQPSLISSRSDIGGIKAVWNATDSRFYVFVAFSAGTPGIDLAVINVASGLIAATITTPISGSGSLQIAAAARPGGGALLMYEVPGSGNNSMSAFNAAGAITSTLNLTNPDGFTVRCRGIFVGAVDRVWFVYSCSNNSGILPTVVRAGIVNATNAGALALTLAPVSVQSGILPGPVNLNNESRVTIVETSTTACLVAFTQENPSTSTRVGPLTRARTMTSAGTVSVNYSEASSVRIMTDAWRFNGRTYVAVEPAPEIGTEPVGSIPGLGSCFIVEPAIIGDNFTNSLMKVHACFGVEQVPVVSLTVFAAQSPRVTPQTPIVDGATVSFIYQFQETDTLTPQSQRCVVSHTFERQSCQLGPRAFISGGVPALYDGTQATEWGFLHIPKIVSTSASAGGLTGTYQASITYEWNDANGDTMRSAPSAIAERALTAQQLTVNAGQLQLSNKVDATNFARWGDTTIVNSNFALVVLYRTTTGSGNPLYRTTDASGGAVPSANLNTYGNALSAIVTSVTDASTRIQPPLFTAGDVVAPTPVPSCRICCAHDNRIFLVADDDTIWYSTFNERGLVPWFNAALRLPTFEGGDVTAMASMDGNLIVWKDSAVFAIAGNGPSNDARGATYSPPRPLASDIGCIDPKSVVLTSVGLFFRSRRGIELLDRGLNITFIGEPVEDTTALVTASATYAGEGAWLRCKSAVAVEQQHQVRWDVFTGTEAGGVRTGRVVVYDYVTQEWSLLRMPGDRAPVAATYFADAYVWFDSAGQYWRETMTAWQDQLISAAYQTPACKARTGWVKPTGVQGFFKALRVSLVGEYGTPHVLTVRLYADYDEATVRQTSTFTLTAAPAAGYQFIVPVGGGTQRMEAIQVECEWTGTGSTLPGAQMGSLSGVSLEHEPFPNQQRRVPAAQQG